MNAIEIKETLKSGGAVFGMMLTASRSPRWAKTYAQSGLDYIIIDTEHTPRSRSEVADLLAAFETTNVAPIVNSDPIIALRNYESRRWCTRYSRTLL